MKYPKGLPSPDGLKKEEIIDLLLTEEYGFLPPAPLSVTAQVVSSEENFCADKAILQKIKLTCATEYGDFTFPISYTCPAKSKQNPVPCFILINFRSLVPDRYEPSEELVDNGYAVLSFCYKDVTSDDGDFTNGLAGVIYPNGRTLKTQCGKIGLWAWAAMRVMDFAQTLPEINHSRISVAGHSRLGKTALLTGALDERFYCAFSNDSGCCGAALSREKVGESVSIIYDHFPYWFCENFAKYGNNEDKLPFDQHYLIAANAPHRVYVASAENDTWADPNSEYLACAAASEYYKKHGLTGFVHPDRLPKAGDFFGEGHIGYHLRSGNHYFSREDWNRYIEYLEKE